MVDYRKVVDCALSQVGYEEPNHDNHQKYGHEIDTIWPTWYNGKKDGFDWCTQFVDWNFLTTYGYDASKILLNRPDKNFGAVVKYAYNYLNAKGRTGNEPRHGAVIYFQNARGLSHTGIVVDFDSTTVTTVEGNSGRGNYFVVKKKYQRNDSYIYGYGYPLYEEVNPQPSPDPDPKTLDGYKVGEKYEVTCKDTLNVRTAASVVNTTIITALKPGTQFVARALTRDDSGNTWMRIDNPVAGWICCIFDGDKYVKEARVDPKTLNGYTVGNTYSVVAKAGLNVRIAPGTNNKKVKVISYGTRVKAIDLSLDTNKNTWMKIDSGWICCIYYGDTYVK